MKFVKSKDKSHDDSITRGVIAEILKEIQDIRKELASRDNESLVLLEIQKNNEIMARILLKLEEISDEIKEAKKPWYSRIICG